MSIFTHVTVGTNQLEQARNFYDATLATIGLKRIADLPNGSIWGKDKPSFFILNPLDGNVATIGNGVTISFEAQSREAVNEFYKTALELGGIDAGEPGPRGWAPNAYAAYVRDLDGNKLAVYSFVE